MPQIPSLTVQLPHPPFPSSADDVGMLFFGKMGNRCGQRLYRATL
jgi:hypothetical protein